MQGLDKFEIKHKKIVIKLEDLEVPTVLNTNKKHFNDVCNESLVFEHDYITKIVFSKYISKIFNNEESLCLEYFHNKEIVARHHSQTDYIIEISETDVHDEYYLRAAHLHERK